jgi:hypothetical protein
VFFSIAAPDGPWAFLLTTAVLAISLGIAMLASGVRSKFVWAWSGVAVLGVGVSILIALTQETKVAGGYLAITSLLLTLATIGAIARRIWLHVEISVITVLGAVCIYVLVGLSFAFVFDLRDSRGVRIAALLYLPGGGYEKRLRLLQLHHHGNGWIRRPDGSERSWPGSGGNRRTARADLPGHGGSGAREQPQPCACAAAGDES